MTDPGRPSPTNTDLQFQLMNVQRDIKDIMKELEESKDDAKIRTEAIAQIRMTLDKMEREDISRVSAAKASWKTLTIGGSVIATVITVVYTVGSVASELIKSWLTH